MPPDPAPHVAAVRRFNRFYTQKIGVLHEGLLQSPYSLAEVRVLYELAQGGQPTASALARALDLDPGYLSRILRGFEARGLVERSPSASDARQSHLALTPAGETEFASLDGRSSAEVAALLGGLSARERERLVGAMATIEELFRRAETIDPYVLRPPLPGDLGWVVHRHGALYAAEYGWDETFEGLVAGIVGDFCRDLDPARERCWIADRDGAVVGSVFLVRAAEATAKLRMLYVEPSERGRGLGRRLVDECTKFAREAGYQKITLWTQSVLVAARRLYASAGYRLVRSEPSRAFGHDLVSETWELDLE